MTRKGHEARDDAILRKKIGWTGCQASALGYNKGMKKALLFIGLTYAIGLVLMASYPLLGGDWSAPGSIVIMTAYMFVPMVAAIIVQKEVYHAPIVGPLGVSFAFNGWFVVAWILPPLIVFAALGVSLLLPGVHFSPGMEGLFDRLRSALTADQIAEMKKQMASLPIHPVWLGLLQGMVAGATVNAAAGFGEELGWRGLLLGEWGPLGFWRSSVLIGLVWGVWHVPVILRGHNYPQHPLEGIAMMTAWTVLLSPIISYIRIRARSVVAASILHGTLTGTSGLAVMLLKGGSDLTVGVMGAAGFAVLAAADAGLFLYDRFVSPEPLMRAGGAAGPPSTQPS